MADRTFAALLLAVSGVYAWLAFTAIRAPFQYDPLGPESWPRILVATLVPCVAWVFVRPDTFGLDTDRGALARLGITLALLGAYAWAFEVAGFVLATFGFSAALARLLGAGTVRALVFGAVSGVAGYLVGAGLLGLNLPAGPLPRI